MPAQTQALRLYLFGLPRIEYQGNPVRIARRKAVALAAHLALADYPQSRDVVADLLWPDLDRDHRRHPDLRGAGQRPLEVIQECAQCRR